MSTNEYELLPNDDDGNESQQQAPEPATVPTELKCSLCGCSSKDCQICFGSSAVAPSHDVRKCVPRPAFLGN